MCFCLQFIYFVSILKQCHFVADIFDTFKSFLLLYFLRERMLSYTVILRKYDKAEILFNFYIQFSLIHLMSCNFLGFGKFFCVGEEILTRIWYERKAKWRHWIKTVTFFFHCHTMLEKVLKKDKDWLVYCLQDGLKVLELKKVANICSKFKRKYVYV